MRSRDRPNRGCPKPKREAGKGRHNAGNGPQGILQGPNRPSGLPDLDTAGRKDNRRKDRQNTAPNHLLHKACHSEHVIRAILKQCVSHAQQDQQSQNRQYPDRQKRTALPA